MKAMKDAEGGKTFLTLEIGEMFEDGSGDGLHIKVSEHFAVSLSKAVQFHPLREVWTSWASESEEG